MSHSPSKPSVCAVVVTFRRPHLLRECLHAIEAQTHQPDMVLVVDNHSGDGTLEMLREEFSAVEILALPDNRGGAGGFHAGMRRAFALGFDFSWVMDDDGRPDARCLEFLCAKARLLGPGVYGAVCVRPDDAAALSFPAPLASEFGAQTTQLAVLESAMDEKRVLQGWAAFMNGVLFGREIVEKAGLPRAEMFIWGDEVEYAKRIKAAGLPLYTVFDARHVHPPDRIQWHALRPGWMVYAGPLDWKAFCFFRNAGYLARHFGRGRGVSMLLRYAYFFGVTRRFEARGWRFFWNAYRAGWQGDFSRRVPF